MALSGSFGSDVGAYWRLQLEWTATQDIGDNSSTVTAKLYWMAQRSGVGAVYASNSDPVSITVDGDTSPAASASPYLSSGQKKLIRTFTTVVEHNSNGSKTMNMSAYFDINATLSGTYYGRKSISGSATLNTIPRASSLSGNANWTAGSDRNTGISTASQSFNHDVRYYVKNSSNSWVLIKDVNYPPYGITANSAFTLAQHTAVFNALNGRTSADSKIEIVTYSGNSLIGTDETIGTVTAPVASYPSMPSYFNVGNAFTITCVKYLDDFTHTVRLKNGSTVLKTYTGISESVSFDTASIAATLRSIMANDSTKDFTMEVLTYYNGVLVRTARTGIIEARILNSYPAFTTAPSYKDTNTVTTTITGNNQIIITDKSIVQAEVTVAGRAIATDGATMVRYVATLGGKTIIKNWSNTAAVTFDFGTLEARTNQTLSIRAEDSRGASTIVTKTVTMLTYDLPTLVASATRVNGFETNTLLNMNGRVSELKVSGVNKNYITAARFRFKETGSGTYGGWNGFVHAGFPVYTVTIREQLLDNTKSYDVQFEIVDRLSTVTVTKKVETGKPLVHFDELLNSIGIGDMPSAANELMIALKVRLSGNKWGADAGMDMANSDMRGVNGLFSNDVANSEGEGFLFLKSTSPAGSTDFNDYESLRGVDGVVYFGGKAIAIKSPEVQWTGAIFLQASQSIPLTRPLSQCPQGVILLWSRYINSAVADSDWNVTFIPKSYNTFSAAAGMWCRLVAANVNDTVPPVAYKYVYPRENSIIGHDRNRTGTESGQVLRAVITM